MLGNDADQPSVEWREERERRIMKGGGDEGPGEEAEEGVRCKERRKRWDD